MEKTYTFLNGKSMDIPVIIDKKDMESYFKVNLPSSEEDFASGNGEGVWACTTEEAYRAWDNDEEGVIFVMILNDSIYYPGLSCGTVIPVELRKKNRPVAFWDELQQEYGLSKKDEAIRFLLPKGK